MDAYDGIEKRQRHLPHWEQPGGSYFITLALRRPAPVDLSDPDVAPLIISALRHLDGQRYWLYEYAVMPDHVHAIVRVPSLRGQSEPLWRILKSLKGFTARRINEATGRSGPLWQQETHDHLIRGEDDYLRIAAYIIDNARRRGLVHEPTGWPWAGRGRGDGP